MSDVNYTDKISSSLISENIYDKAKKRERIYAFKFAAVLSFICCMLLTGASVGLKRFQIENMEIDRQKNILKAAGVIGGEDKISKKEIKEIYKDKIKEIYVDSNGDILNDNLINKHDSKDGYKNKTVKANDTLPLYLYENKAYIIPIESKGLWGKIYGYLAFKNDGVTIEGFTVYSHSETPGLGGEIEKAWFQKNFAGKKIVNNSNEFISIAIAKGSASNLSQEEQINHVDGISGATLTGKYLTEGLKQNLEHYESVSIKFRQGKHF